MNKPSFVTFWTLKILNLHPELNSQPWHLQAGSCVHMLDCQPVSDQVAEAAGATGKVLIAAEDPDNFSQPGGRFNRLFWRALTISLPSAFLHTSLTQALHFKCLLNCTPEKGGRPHPALPHGFRTRAHEGRAGVPAALELRAQLDPLEAGFEEGEEEPELENLSY